MEELRNIVFKISEGLGLGVNDSIVLVLSGVALFVSSIAVLFKSKKKQPETLKSVPKKNTIEARDTVENFSIRLFKGLGRTRSDVWNKIGSILSSGSIDSEQEEALEEILFSADLSPSLASDILERLKKGSYEDYKLAIKELLSQKMSGVQAQGTLDLFETKPSKMKVIMIVGVNGAGKTTTIGKIATKLQRSGNKVVVGACDTFRAAAVEQLEVWCKRANVEMVRAPDNADPSGVAFDTVKKAQEMGADFCIIDTAGRLHTASNLMDELKKTKKVMSKLDACAPHEVVLVVDAITGQNAIEQATQFNKALGLTGLVFTKCDGSSKAGSAVSIVEKLQVPILYIGVGEDVEDLGVFDLDAYLNALIGLETEPIH